MNTAEEQLVPDIYLQTSYSISLGVNANLPISYLMALVVNASLPIGYSMALVVDANLLIGYSMVLVVNGNLQIGYSMALVVEANLLIVLTSLISTCQSVTLCQGFSTFWYLRTPNQDCTPLRTPKSNSTPFAYPPNQKFYPNKLVLSGF